MAAPADSAPAQPGGGVCPIAGIGASAGGLEAFTRLLRALPEEIGMALVLVQHLDPTQQSMLADILGRVAALPVTEAVDGAPVEQDHVYVMPPNVSIRVTAGLIRLEKRAEPPMPALPIDTLLRSIAEECANVSIGVVLSGTGTDGVQGLTAIRAAGGLTFAQDPSTADYDGMPKSSIEAGVVDAALDPEGIAAELVRLGRHSDLQAPKPPEEAPEAVDEESFAKILSLVRQATGLDLSSYRRTTLVRRISRRMLLEGVADMKDYLGVLQQDPAEVDALYRDVLVNMTEFFRDPAALDALKREAFPELLERKEHAGTIRIWVAGCSKGQEAYSILITLVEFLAERKSSQEIQMFATDVNEQDVDFARAGVYPQGMVTEVSPERLARYFAQVPGGYQIDRSIREMCVFAVHDVTKDPPFSKLDLISLRNVLIYMERPLQQRVLQIMHYALEPGGFLLLGTSETTGHESTLFSVVDKKQRIYKRKPGPGKLLSALAPSSVGLGFARRAGPEQEAPAFDVLAEAERVVQGGYQPAGILITADFDVLQFRGHVGPYLDPAQGSPEFKMQRLVAPGLASTVEVAVREAAETRKPAKRRGSTAERDGERRDVDIEVVPIASPNGESYYLVLLDERPTRPRKLKPQGKRGAAQEHGAEPGEVSTLRRELAETREQLDSVVADREAANSDLRSASEKYQSSNEELRTINEEFQTAQEELQSTNEELTTLNDELRNRNTDLARLADDLNNVIEGVEIPILILDADLRIRRFTPQVEAIVSAVPADVGRVVTDLSLKVGVSDFTTRSQEVLRRGSPSQTEVQTSDGRWYLMRIRPYRTAEGHVDGVVVAFLDIDELKRTTRASELARDHAEAVVETVREPLLTLGADLHVREANEAFYKTFAVTHEETIGSPIYKLGDGQWDFPELRALLDRVLPGDEEFAGLTVQRDFPRIGRRAMLLSARRVREEHGQPSILFALDDVTEATRRERLTSALNNIGVTIGSTLEFERTLSQVLKQATEALDADSGMVLLNQDDTWVMKNVYGLPAELEGRVLDEAQVPVSRLAAEEGEPVFLDDISKNEKFAKSIGLELELHSIVMVPLLLREETMGSLSFHYRTPVVRFSDADVDFARRLGTLLSLALENAKLYSTQREIATTLQSALLTVPRHVAGVDFGHLYRSATSEASVGGDFYDLFELEGGRAGVLLGDVSGKGIEAATLTALVKNSIRALAYEIDSPAAVVDKTNAVIYKATVASMFVTLVFCVLDTTSGQLVYCSAGHTRGIVKRRQGATELLTVGSPLAGALDSAEFTNGEMTLETGDTLVLYTDGVTEAKRDGELFGEDRLVEFVRGMPPTPVKKVPAAVFDEVLRFTGGTLSDDVAIVSVARRHGGAGAG